MTIALFTPTRPAMVSTLSIFFFFLILVLVVPSHYSALAQDDTAKRIQAKIQEVGANATRLRESGADVSPIQTAIQQVDRLLRSGKVEDAEKVLDSLLLNRDGLATAAPRTQAIPTDARTCDPHQPMKVSGSLTLYEDCTIGGDLTVTGTATLFFDFSRRNGGRLAVSGNIIVEDQATLWIRGRPDKRAVFVVDNEHSQQRSMTSTDTATIKLDYVEFRTQSSANRQNGSMYMGYEARGHSSFRVTGSTLAVEEAWLLANMHDSAKLTVTDSQSIPTEIYIRDSSFVSIVGNRTEAGLWLDMGDATGTLKVPDTNRPFSWQVGAQSGLGVGWSLSVDNARPGLGVEVKPASRLTILGNGSRAPATGELKISYFVANSRDLLDGLSAGLQNRSVGDRLTLKNVQLGPIAWQVYAGENADLTIRNSTINEIGIFGGNAKVRVERSVLQLAVLAALAPGSLLDIRDSDVWNQSIEAANGAQVVITDSKVYGSLFHVRDAGSFISIKGGAFYENPAGCTEGTMVNVATGRPKCNPFRTPGMPRSAGTGKIGCAGTENCKWSH